MAWLHWFFCKQSRRDVGLLFVDRGSDAQRLCEDAKTRGLDNVVFHDEIEPSEIPSLKAGYAVQFDSL